MNFCSSCFSGRCGHNGQCTWPATDGGLCQCKNGKMRGPIVTGTDIETVRQTITSGDYPTLQNLVRLLKSNDLLCEVTRLMHIAPHQVIHSRNFDAPDSVRDSIEVRLTNGNSLRIYPVMDGKNLALRVLEERR